MKRTLFLLSVVAMMFLSAGNPAERNIADFARQYLNIKYNKNPETFLYIGVQRQKLYLIKNNSVVTEYTISTSKHGCGQELHSEKTPLGLHKVHSLAGKNAPLGGIIKGSNFTGKMAVIIKDPVSTGQDEVTTRAIRLEGTEHGFNKGGKVDSFKREIYIHGTPEEGLIGKPVSHGCIRMKNQDVIELFNHTNPSTFVLLLNN